MHAVHGAAMHGRYPASYRLQLQPSIGPHVIDHIASSRNGRISTSSSSRLRRRLVIPWAKKDPKNDEKADPKKADFSAYWSLKFKEFFSKRRQYLELSRKRKEPPEIVKKLDAQIQFLQGRLEEQAIERRKATEKEETEFHAQVAAVLQQLDQLISEEEDQKLMAEAREEAQKLAKFIPGADKPPEYGPMGSDEVLYNDTDLARGHLHSTRTKVFTLTPIQLRGAAKALVLLPFTLASALFSRWQALFAGQRYENFLMAEGERVWYWRNRTENERWFWEEFVFDRFLIPLIWTLCYEAIVPNNLIWAVLVPLSIITWQNGQMPSPANMEWWLIMIFGLYAKCWDQVLAFIAMLLQWW